jgi:polysaccharide biosynthesis protein PslH
VLQVPRVAERPTRELLLLAPIMPAAGGNGLAMRAGVQLRALAEQHDVRLVVVPVGGGPLDPAWARRFARSVSVVGPDDATALRLGVTELVRSAVWRTRFQRADPLPVSARFASAGLAASVTAAARPGPAARVHAIRGYLAPLAVALAERLGSPSPTLDLDDDDEHLLDQEGRHDEARAHARLVDTFGPEFAWVSLASPLDAARVAARHGLRAVVVPNSVTLSDVVVGRTRRTSGPPVVVLVGNLTYGPNVTAAERLVDDVLPRLRRLVGGRPTVELVGGFEPDGRVASLAGREGVVVRGYVDDLDDVYARADVTVIPLEHGAGTRIKLLEALAAGVPAVTSAIGAAGIGAEDGTHLLIAEDAGQQAAAAARILHDDELAASLVRAGRALVAQRFDSRLVARQLRALMDDPTPASRADRSAHEVDRLEP